MFESGAVVGSFFFNIVEKRKKIFVQFGVLLAGTLGINVFFVNSDNPKPNQTKMKLRKTA